MKIFTSPLAKLAVEIEGIVRKKMSLLEAQRWLILGNPAFDGMSPVGMIKAGRHEEVRRVAEEIAAP